MSAARFWGSGVAFPRFGVDLGWFGFALPSPTGANATLRIAPLAAEA
jgi:hypothetical protein